MFPYTLQTFQEKISIFLFNTIYCKLFDGDITSFLWNVNYH
ncbi:hypothetical protein GCWU000325_01140 [Alloprevotella tannerae ATCC 51259]|uniref:Uncharacterized protein n=1 Tax=Alloprevotella tannerae ATCC 51259 TaxID=626522 RepID=C9LG02_9BACT|nr:hypothetical protein GCWU000325_01140 [Alloprevotella tannerae ATCC 51259]